jgi:vanillate/3-O-methylgallate O-demethylase
MTLTMTDAQTLEQRIQGAGGPVSLLRGPHQLGPYAFPGIPNEFTNWRDEVCAWKDGVALLEQSYHMSELHLRGTEVIPFLSTIAVNRFDPFPVRRAKQLVVASPDGYLIGDAILFHEDTDFLRLVGSPMALDWVQFNAESTSFDVGTTLDHNWSVVEHPRDVFRFQIQGVHALDLVTEAIDGPLPEVGFFGIAEISIANKRIRALRHGMAGTPGFEIYGAWADQQPVRERLEELGAKYGLRKVGAFGYATTAQESGWLPLPLPAIYHGEHLKPYREWTSTFSLESMGSLGGSLMSDQIEDYYVDPIEAGYKNIIDWDRDFLGRDALAERAENQQRKKVTLVWNDADVTAVNESALFGTGTSPQYIALPSPMYATWAADAVLNGGETIGFSQYMSYSANARHILSHGIIDVSLAEPGTELTLLWGEPNSRRDNVGSNELREIRVTVAPSPYFAKVIKTGTQ